MSYRQLTVADRKFSTPLPQIVSWVVGQIPAGAKVLEIGPGRRPFSRATHFVDWASFGKVADDRLIRCDLQRDPLPFADKAWDFVYCRHVLEDLYDPFHLCEEMSRVAKAGYLETPSPIAELCRGVDGGSPAWRGYHHHRYLVWSKGGMLRFLSKYPAVEHVALADETAPPRILRQNPLAWNTCFLWRDKINFEFLQHGKDYTITRDYRRLLHAAINEGLAASKVLAATIGRPAPAIVQSGGKAVIVI